MRLAALALLAGIAPAAAQDGAALFQAHCAACHSLDRVAAPGPGPNLAGLGGRPVAGDPAYDYSPALRAGRAAGDRWDAARLARFLADPDEMYPGLWMSAVALRDPALISAIARYLTER